MVTVSSAVKARTRKSGVKSSPNGMGNGSWKFERARAAEKISRQIAWTASAGSGPRFRASRRSTIACSRSGAWTGAPTSRFACPICSYSIPELEPRLFSFNNPMGACPRCDGLGEVTFFDPKRVVAFPHLSLAGGAVRGWDRRNQFYFSMLVSLAQHYGFDVDAPFESLPARAQEVVLSGSGEEKIAFRYPGEKGRTAVKEHAFEGILPNLERRYRETDSVAVKEELAKYLNTRACPACGGTRLRVEAPMNSTKGRISGCVSASAFRRSTASSSFSPER